MDKKLNGMHFSRNQLPLKLIYCGTCHKSQGLTLKKVVIDLTAYYWKHCHIYVAHGRVKDPKNLCNLLPQNENNDVQNSHFIPLLQNDQIV